MLTNTQTYRLTAVETLHQVMQEEAPQYSTDKPLIRLVGEIGAWLTALAPLRHQVQQTPGNSAGAATDDKSAARHTLVTVAAEISGDATAYANEYAPPPAPPRSSKPPPPGLRPWRACATPTCSPSKTCSTPCRPSTKLMPIRSANTSTTNASKSCKRPTMPSTTTKPARAPSKPAGKAPA